MTTITVEVDGKSHQVTVDDSFTSLSPEQQEAEVQHIAQQIGQSATSGGGKPAGPSLVDKVADYLGLTDEMLKPAIGGVLGATSGAAIGPTVGEGVDFIANKLAGKMAAPGVVPPEGVPGGVTSWLKEETGHPYAGGKTKEEAYAKSQRAAGQPVQSRGADIKIRKGNLGISNQLEPQKVTLPQKAAANIINAEKVNAPNFTRRLLGMGVAGGELGNVIEELQQGNYGRAALSGLGALGGAASQSKIKPVRAIGTGLSAIIPPIQMMLPSTEEDVSNINKKAGGSVQNFQVGGTVLKKAAPQVAEGAKKYSDIIQNYIGKVLHPTIVDTTKVDLPLGKMGGPEASNLQNISPLHKAEDWVFANDSMAAAKRLHNVSQRNDGNAIITGLLGSPYQLKTNRSVFGDLSDEFYKAIAAGKLDPDLLQKYQDAMKASTYKTNKGMMTTFPEQFDIRDRAALEANSKLFHQRAALADIMGGKGPTGVQLGGKKGQIFNWEDVLGAARDPNTIGAPTQSIGTRLFTLNERAPEYRPDLHNAFDYALFGKDLGHSFAPVPKEVGYPDAIEAIRQSNIAKGKKPDVTSMHLSRNILTQPITEDYVKAVQASGYAPGGKVMKSAVEEFKKQFTGGFYHGSPSNKIKAFNSAKNKDPNKLETPGVTFVTRDPDFAESFLPMTQRGQYASGATMYPVKVKLGKHWNPSQPESQQVVEDYLAKMYPHEANPDDLVDIKKQMLKGNWIDIENPNFLQHLRDTGHDTFHIEEGGVSNVGVLKPENIRGKFAEYNPEEAMNPDFMKAEGGAVEGYAPGGLVKLLKHAHGQNPKVAQALEEYLKGNISQEDRIRILNQNLPIRKWSDLPPNYTDEQIRNALMANKQAKALAPVPVGAKVGNRLDIPAYTQHGVYVDTTHDVAGKPISYGRTGHLKDVEFSSKPNQAVRVGLGTKEQALTPMGTEIGSAKSPFALIKGTNVGTSDEEVRRMMEEMLKDPRYTQIGMDPRRHSQFYDKETGLPVWAAEEKLQSGPLIIAPKQGLEITDWNDPRLNLSDFEGKKYKKGSKVKKKK